MLSVCLLALSKYFFIFYEHLIFHRSDLGTEADNGNDGQMGTA